MSTLDFLFGPGGLEAAARTTWSEPARTIVEGFGLEDECKSTGARAAFPLAGAGAAWLLLSGTLDVFLAADGGDGARQFAFRASAGQLVLAPDGGEAAGLVAVPSNGAELVATSRQALGGLAPCEGELGDAMTRAVEGWVALLAASAAPGVPPAGIVEVSPGEPFEVAAGRPFVPRAGVWWVPSAVGAHALAGAPDDEPAPTRLPVTRAIWLTPGEAATVSALDTAAWLATPDAATDLAAFERRAFRAIAEKLRAARARADARVGEALANRSDRLSRALAAMAGVLAPRAAPIGDLPAEPHSFAAAVVWRAMGLDITVGPATQRRVAQSADPVSALAYECALHVRAIALEGEWWRQDHGPLLGFHGDDRRPCALLPAGGRRYVLVDVEDGERRAVDRALAATVEERAFEFARPFPAESLTARALLRFGLRGGGRDGLVVLAMVIATGILSLVAPLVTSWIVDPVIPEAALGELRVLIGALIVAAAATGGFALTQAMAMLRLEGRMSNRVQVAVWDRLLRLPASFFRGFTVGDLANRAQGIDRMRSVLTGTLTTALLYSVSGLFSIALMIYYGWLLALVTFLVAVVYTLIVLLVGRHILLRNRETMALTGQIQGLVLQLLSAVPKLRIAGAEPAAFARWAGPYSRLISIAYRQQRLNMALIILRHVFHFIAAGGVIAVIALQGHELWAFFTTPDDWSQIAATTLHQVMPTGDFVAFNVAFGQFIAAVFGLSQGLVQLANIKPLYERIQPVLEAQQEDVEGSEDPGELAGAVEARELRFRYGPDKPLVLDGLTFRAAPGEFVAIVGPSGAGKSTLVRILLGFDRPESGSLFFDGRDIKHLDKRLLRRQFGVVLQSGRLLSGSIFNNIAAGANIDRDRAMEAARLAGLDKDIESMPMGLDTFLGEGATTLSGGQRQRLMIARAVARHPRILIFDEATSALDNETQAIVTSGLASLRATRIVIAHRLSTIVGADRIFVIDRGRVVEEGTYDTLMAKNGLFAALARRQMA